MRKDKIKSEPAVEAAVEGRQLAEAVKAAIDNGALNEAELLLVEARQSLGEPKTSDEFEVALTLALEMSTIAQYRGDFHTAWDFACSAVEFADENFGPRGIHVGRARLRRNFAMEAKREFSKARQANLELADELVRVPGSDGLRLNCLTRAIACAVKNADRGHLQAIGVQAEPIWEKLNKPKDHAISRWFLYWCAIASLRQHQVKDSEALLDYAGRLGPQHWRWANAALFAHGHGMTLRRPTRKQGAEMLEQARQDAESRGFHGLVKSIDAGLSG